MHPFCNRDAEFFLYRRCVGIKSSITKETILQSEGGFDPRCGADRIAARACHWHAIHCGSRSNPFRNHKKDASLKAGVFFVEKDTSLIQNAPVGVVPVCSVCRVHTPYCLDDSISDWPGKSISPTPLYMMRTRCFLVPSKVSGE